MTQPYLTLNDGHRMPQLGAGTWQLPEDEAPALVRAALKTGYRLIDTAMKYENEKGVGQGLHEAGLPRTEIFITTKLWNIDQGRDATRRAFDASLKRLGLDYLDLYLIHWPVPSRDLYVESWKAMIELRDEGRVRSIGVANFERPHLERLIRETGVAPALNQIELHPHFTQDKMRTTDAEFGIITQSWSPLGQATILHLPEITKIATGIGRTAAQVILRWHLQKGLSVIPKTAQAARLAENFAALDFTLSTEDIATIDALDQGRRIGPHPEQFELL